MSLSILTVHAHPDDESSKGPGTVNLYASQGIRTTLVCCTGGEEGDILNPAMERQEIKEDLASVRLAELDSAAAIIGYDEVVMLGYRDSGMPDSEANPHPDHLQVTAISIPAFERAGDPDWYPEAGEPFEPLKLYAPIWSRQRLLLTHQAFLDRGLDSPYDEKWLSGKDRDDRISAMIPVDNAVRRKALLAHATQVDPKSPFWFGLPDDVQDAIHPFEEYMLLRSRVPTEELEEDLFEGLRDLDGVEE